MNLDQARQNLLHAAQANRSYAFLQAALSYLDQVPEDAQIRLRAVEQFLRLGLAVPAVELIDARPEIVQQAPDLQPLLASLRARPSGQIHWRERASLFAGNLQVALDRFETCRAHEQRIREATRGLDLFQCSDGNYQLSRRLANAPRRWLPAIQESVRTIEKLNLCPAKGTLFSWPYLIEGVGFGHAIRKIYDGTRRMFLAFSPRIHILEPNCAQLAVWFHLADLRDLLGDERVHLWIGPGAAEAFMAFHRACPAHPLPQGAIRQQGWASAAKACGQQALDILFQETDAETQRLAAEINHALRDRGRFAHCAGRFEDRQLHPLRILGITSRFTTFLQHSMRDIQQAVETAGHQFRLIIEHDDHSPMVPHVHTLSVVRSFLPDLIVMIDHNRHEFGDLYDFPIPFCCWIQDDLPNLFAPDAGRKLHPFDVVAGHISRFRGDASGYPRSQCCPVPVPVNPRVFSNRPVPTADREPCRCDISFVSNLSVTADEFLRQNLEIAKWPEIRKLLQALHDDLEPKIAAGRVPASPVQTMRIIQALAADLGFDMPDQDADQLRRNFADRLINIFFRHQALEWAAGMEINLHLYGRGWESHPTLGRYARGVAENGYHLRTIFQASRINLQLIPSAAVHQRLLEGLSSGGFFLMRRTPFDVSGDLAESIRRRCTDLNIETEDELWNTSDEQLARDVRALNDALYAPARLYHGFVAELQTAADRGYRLEAGVFLPRYDEVSFASRDEFERLAQRFLADENARQEIAALQRRRIMETLTYDAVMERIFEFLATYFASRAAAEPCPIAV